MKHTMYILFALFATVLTSFLPILNKQLLRDIPPTIVAWAVNAFSLPVLAAGSFLLTQCAQARGTIITCSISPPRVDVIFVTALLCSIFLNWGATLLSTHALKKADASKVSPLLTFNPAFTLLLAWPVLGEIPGLRQTIGVVVLLAGTYSLDVQEARTGLLSPLHSLLGRPGALYAIIASAFWGATTVLEKISIEHMTPTSGPFVAFISTFLTVVLLTPAAIMTWRKPRNTGQESDQNRSHAHFLLFTAAATLAGIAPLFGFTAIAVGYVGYVTALFKLSTVFTIIWAWIFLKEGRAYLYLPGALIMIAGGIIISM